jgi:Domain of unknown function (DUF5076)
MDTNHQQLSIPKIAQEDSNSFEVLRVWIALKNQHYSIRPGVWNDPAAWGILLADLAHHIVNSYEPKNEPEKTAIIQRIKLAFNLEIDTPTDQHRGDNLESEETA